MIHKDSCLTLIFIFLLGCGYLLYTGVLYHREYTKFINEKIPSLPVFLKTPNEIFTAYRLNDNQHYYIRKKIKNKDALPSGEMAYIFDMYGKLIDSTFDDGESPFFCERWDRIDSGIVISKDSLLEQF